LAGSVVLPLPDPMLPVGPKLPVVLVASPGCKRAPDDPVVEFVPTPVPAVPGPDVPPVPVCAIANGDIPIDRVAAMISAILRINSSTELMVLGSIINADISTVDLTTTLRIGSLTARADAGLRQSRAPRPDRRPLRLLRLPLLRLHGIAGA
jgi:hypothetical protein